MHGAGNDYVYVDLIAQPALANHPAIRDPTQLAIQMSDRQLGIGSDGLILILPALNAAAEMRMFNADGSEAEMCGNGLRCLAHLLVTRQHIDSAEFPILTGHGLLHACVADRQVRVQMGRPILRSDLIPTTLPGCPPMDVKLEIGQRKLTVTCVSMGNPHCVVFCDELTDDLVLKYGPQIENSLVFPRRTNVEFARVINRTNVDVRVWERGSGPTLACGTGACAVAVAGILSGRLDSAVYVNLPGGTLVAEWAPVDGADGEFNREYSGDVFLSGPVVEVFQGEWPLNS